MPKNQDLIKSFKNEYPSTHHFIHRRDKTIKRSNPSPKPKPTSERALFIPDSIYTDIDGGTAPNANLNKLWKRNLTGDPRSGQNLRITAYGSYKDIKAMSKFEHGIMAFKTNNEALPFKFPGFNLTSVIIR
jgi:hypothetical protein